jgi:photosystem II stability/assembly factor-like uncharacterized protein
MPHKNRYTPLFSVLSLSLFAVGLFQIGNLLEPQNNPKIKGAHPGYFEQWKLEKQNIQGFIPKWVRNAWHSWDIRNQQFSKRNDHEIFDTIIEVGPLAVGGRTRALWIDPANDQHLLAGGISGGLWKTTNKGNSWYPVNEHEVSMMPSCITSNPFNHNIIYYGTGESRANSADVSGNGVFKSVNRGVSFEQLSSTVGVSGMDEIWDIKHSLDDSNTLFVGTNAQGLYRSKDGGSTWDKAYNGGNKQVNNILILPNKRILISMHSSGVLASDSNGDPNTWVTLTFPDRPASFRRIQLANCASAPNVVYALFEGFGFSDPPAAFYKSSNGGRTWVKRTTPTQIGAGYQRYCVMLGNSPHDSNYVVAGGVNAAYSLNGGQSWTQMSGTHADHHSFAGFNQTKNEYAIGSDGGVYFARWGTSAAIKDANNGYRVTQFYAGGAGFKGLECIGGTQDNGTHMGKLRFVSEFLFGGDGAYSHIGQQDGDVAYLSTQNEGIRRIDNFKTGPRFFNNIASVDFTNEGVNFINAYNMNEEDQYMLFYRTNRGIHRTVDGGESWQRINPTTRSGLKAIGISHDKNPVLYFGGSAAQLYKLENAATAVGTEVNFNNSVPAVITNDFLNFIEVNPKNKYQIFCAFSNYSDTSRIWKVSNLDTDQPEWVDISANLPKGLPVNSVAVDPRSPEHYIFAATDFGLYYTLDGGITWHKEMRIPSVAVHEVKIRNSDRTLFAFTHGRGIWYLKLKDKQTQVEPLHTKVNIQIKPNPVTDNVHIQSTNTLHQIEIYDVKGVKRASQETTEGLETTLNMERLPKGMYFLKIHTATQTITHRIIKS